MCMKNVHIGGTSVKFGLYVGIGTLGWGDFF